MRPELTAAPDRQGAEPRVHSNMLIKNRIRDRMQLFDRQGKRL
jgi:hypothetical protein